MVALIPLLSLALTVATTVLGKGEERIHSLEFCQDSTYENYLKPAGRSFGSLNGPNLTGTGHNRYCFHFGGNFVDKKSFPSKAKVGIVVYDKDNNRVWNERQSLCEVLTKAPATVGCSTEDYPDIKQDESTIEGCLSLVTTDLTPGTHVEGKRGTVYVDFYNNEGDGYSFLCASGYVELD
ncbi:hypothetical protein BGZ96_001317 [Linnemannia gamsii]|uniref:Uncharacterized protein n=1 Tax=Linnemannia gamsii TaxID=64522 RepID=A0ABQ7JN36_9FUNG|nr:hypothetical protein BGZ96_001317 [Linnemannia gamsii]